MFGNKNDFLGTISANSNLTSNSRFSIRYLAMAPDRHNKLKGVWEERALAYNGTKRAVLFKRLPTWLNYYIHARHIRFINKAINSSTRRLLDIGCGYGRISGAIKKRIPKIQFQGIELSEEFAKQYESTIGPCHCGPVEDYTDTVQTESIVAVTVLMYIRRDELESVLLNIWNLLEENGTMTVIEPSIEFMNLWRRTTATESASPTGGNVTYFEFEELKSLLNQLPQVSMRDSFSLNLVPFVRSTAIHHGFTVKKLAAG